MNQRRYTIVLDDEAREMLMAACLEYVKSPGKTYKQKLLADMMRDAMSQVPPMPKFDFFEESDFRFY